MNKLLVLCLLTIVLFTCFSEKAQAYTLNVVMDTWETGTMFETDFPAENQIRFSLWDGMSREERDMLPEEAEYIGIWLTGWMPHDVPLIHTIDSVWLIDAPPGVYLSSRIGKEDSYFERQYTDRERICLYIAVEKSLIETPKIERILKDLKAAGSVILNPAYRDYFEHHELDFDFSQIRQREFHERAVVTAIIERCEPADLDTIKNSRAYYVGSDLIAAGNVAYWIVSGKVDANMPVYNVQAFEQSDDLDMTLFENDTWLFIGPGDFQSLAVISCDEREPTYEEVVRLLHEARLYLTFSPEPRMMLEFEVRQVEFGPHYWAPFDLSALER